MASPSQARRPLALPTAADAVPTHSNGMSSTAQVALSFGVNDIDGTVQEEKIYHMAGADTPSGLTRNELVRLIREAGRHAVERDTLYNRLWEDDGGPLDEIRLDASVPYSAAGRRVELPIVS